MMQAVIFTTGSEVRLMKWSGMKS